MSLSRLHVETARSARGAASSLALAFALVLTLGWGPAWAQNPEPAGWYAGDMHVHRSCGGSPVPVSTIYNAMVAQNVSVVSLLADMGNAEVKDPVTDLPLVTGGNDPASTPDHIIHWDAEWHWDATYTDYPHQALGGHLVNLGLTEAHQIWEEYTYPITQWAHQQGGISGFAHMQYQDDAIPTTLNCCLPIEYPVEVALGGVDFISEDVSGSETAVAAYYRLLNCGFRPGFAAGSDYPCGASIGPLLTYAQVDGALTYAKWIDGIGHGRTVVSRNGHNEFLDLQVNGTATPGDEVQLTEAGGVQVAIEWTANSNQAGTIELVRNGVVVASKAVAAAPDTVLRTVYFPTSGWLCARLMRGSGHVVHTAAVFVTVAGAPVRASVADAQFFVDWIDALITKTSAGGVWNSFFPTSLAAAQARYQAAKTIYQQIAAGGAVTPLVVAHVPAADATNVAVGASVSATFSEALNAATVTTATFQLRHATEDPLAASVTYDAIARAATLTPSTALAHSTVYTATLKGGSSGIKDEAGNALTADVVWSFTTADPDLTPPTVTATSPAADAGEVSPATTVSATFSEALAPVSVSGTTFLLKDAAEQTVAATVAYTGGSLSATLTPSALLPAGTYTATLTSGITDVAGNPLAGHIWSFTVTDFNCPCSIWALATVPGTVADPDASANELGMKFRAAVGGYVTGVRFYKSATNTGTHIGNLWSRSGALLATATFSGESSSGWQEVAFDSPVAITAGTTYIVSYHTNTGHYSEDDGYFTSGLDSGPLRALGNGEDGVNGVYAKSSTSTFPSTGYESSNYWVDVVFATSIGPDVTHPTVASHVPVNDATGVAVGAAVTVTMSEALDGRTVTGSTFELRGPGSAPVPAAVSNDVASRTVTLAPTGTLAYSTIYTATLKGGLSGVKDLAGNELEADVTWSFTTQDPPPPPPTEGPGGPILVISTATNPFSRYFVEILRAEGLNEFTAMDISLVTPETLTAYDVVILGEMSLTADQVTMLTDWTTAGGTLIAMRPDAQLAGLLGIAPAGGTLANQYLLVNTASGPGVGIVGQTIQFHGTADLYTLNGATSVATLYSTVSAPTTNPAVTLRGVGSNGGQAVAFTYDLARSVVYTRQGNPAWAGQKRDGQIEPIRSDDLFYGNASFDPQPDWVNLDKVAIPQADEQQRLLANLITLGNLDHKPLPRFWYLPKGLKAAFVMTGDNHGDGGMRPRFNVYMSQSPTGCSWDDWGCVCATGYFFLGGSWPDSAAARYEAYGYESAPHINTNCARATPEQFESFVTSQVAAFKAAYPSLPAWSPITNRNHCIAWSDWSSVAEIEAAHGIRLDTNYYYWPYSWFNGRSGHFTGSGMPMRFAKLDGTLIDCYQANTQLTDDSYGVFTQASTELVNRALGPEGYYAVITCNLHFDDPDDPGSREIVAVAQANGVPVVSAKQMLTWLDGRNNSSFANLVWGDHTLSFSIAAATGSRNMRAMLPTQSAVGQLTGITWNAAPLTLTTQTIKGIEYAFFPAEAGDYVATYLVDETAPTITAVVATPHDDGTATITWTTNEASDSRVDYDLDAETLDLSRADPALVTSHSVTLTGLSASSTYYYRVTSADAASNDTTEPPTSPTYLPPLSFTTPAPVCALDATAAQFAQGTTGANTYVTTIADGELILAPALAQEFAGTTLPSGWQSSSWPSGGSATVAGGQLVVDGADAYPPQTFGPGSSIEFVATFRADGYQNIGFNAGGNFAVPWITIGTGTVGGGVYARVNDTADVSLGSGLLGAPHRYRIDWTADSFVFYVDGTQVATRSLTVAGPLYVSVSDYTLNGTTLQMDWLRGTPYASSGSFLSRVFDTGGTAQWDAATWTADLPAGTSLAIYVRKGDSAIPDVTWSDFTLVPTSGTGVGGSSRYLQYRADLTTSNVAVTPVLRDMHVSCTLGEDTSPPVISGVAATPAGTGVSALITWETNESADSYVDYGTSPGSLLQSAGDGARVLSHSVTLTGLSSSTTYYFRVRSTDASGHGTTEPVLTSAPLSFSTSVLTCLVDDTAADFGGGTPVTGTVVVAEAGNGEVTLKPAAGSDFAVLPPTSEWRQFALNVGGTATVTAGQLVVDGARFNTEPIATTYGPGTRLECVATFNAAQHEYIGFGGGDDAVGTTGVFYGPPWAMFGTATAGQVYARVYAVGGSMIDYPIPGSASLLGTAHKYRIDWTADSFAFYVDDALVHSETITLPAMRVAMSDLTTGGPTLSVDWIRVTPYAASGSFLSRVYDAGASTTWGNITWVATLPAGTSLQMSTRAGSTPTPDETWTPFTRAAASGAAVGGSSRYLQYSAALAATDTYLTPSLDYVEVTCDAGTDATPPVISSVTATAGPDGKTATVAWGTNELATSRVDYGTAPGGLTLNAANPSLVGTHSLPLSGLTVSTTYYYRVTSTDAAGNSSTEPPLTADPLSFTTNGPPCVADAAVADFSAGDPGSGTYVSETADGEIILKPTEGAEFSGTALPAGWMSGVYGGSPAVVDGGHVSVDGAYAATTAFYAAGRSVEFVATFDAAAALQHAGFGNDLNAAPWAIFSTNTGGILQARSNNGTETNETIPGIALGVSHRFRIDWGAAQIKYWVDGALVATHDVAITANMRPIVSDGPVGGNPLQADWVRMTPYAASGSYASPVFDGGGTTTWGVASWTSSVPTNTSLAMLERHGNTPVPDGTWTSFTAIPAPGTNLAAAGRYLQYRADLATSDVVVTPALLDVAIACTATPDNAPPVITNVVATPTTGGVSATVTWTTDELADSRVDYGTSSGSLTSSVTDAGFVVSHSLVLDGLSPGTTYHYRVTSADVSTNSASSPAPPSTLSFATLAAPCPSDATAADFGLGTLEANTTIALEGDGEVILSPAVVAEFSGTALPSGWWSSNYTYETGGSTTVGGGAITVNGAHAYTLSSFGPGRSLEFVATFTPAIFQNVGFAGDSLFGSPWVVIGEGSAPDGVYARASTGASTLLSATALGSPHRYRIDWNASDFVFYVDGVQSATITLTVASSMVAQVSDVYVGANALSVDWLRVTPYAASGTFLSRVFDGYGPTNWGAITWTASVPGGSGLAISVRTGNASTPDGSWSAYDVLTNGAAVGANSRYIQYRADLTSASPYYATPVLRDLAIACVAGADVTSPAISNVVATPGIDGQSATIAWTTDERATSRVDYGTDPNALSLNLSDGGLVRPHSVALTGLTPGVTYYYRVTSVDGAGNSATDPTPPSSYSFTTPMQPCFVDQDSTNFGAGTLTNAAVSIVTDGEVILSPTLGTEFSGSSLPTGWTSVLWSNGSPGGTSVSNGVASVDGGRLTPTSTTGYTAGRVLEFVATFGAANYQHLGLGSGDNTTSGTGMYGSTGVAWAMFSTHNTGGTQVYARINNPDRPADNGDFALGSSYINTSHRYRVEWRADSLIFLIDGASVLRRAAAITRAMRPGLCDYTTGGPTLQADWLRLTPYVSSGTFLSRVYDGGGPKAWGAANWTANLPTGTSLAMSVRGGNVSNPSDPSWTAWKPIASSGGSVGICSRYLQYEAVLGTTDVGVTPALQAVSITCGPGEELAAVTDLLAVPATTGNDGSGRTKVLLTWTGGGGGGGIKVYRKGYGHYPSYGGGAEPTPPESPAAAVSAEWILVTGVTTSGQIDQPDARDYWYYVAFKTDLCGNPSAVSNKAGGVLNYMLGDVHDGSELCEGDNLVDMSDVSALGEHYGVTISGPSDPLTCLDVGPTTDYTVHSRPTPDGSVEFEDLVLFALNFTFTPPPGAPATAEHGEGRPAAAAANGLALAVPALPRVGETFAVTIRGSGKGDLQALSLALGYDRAVVEMVGADAGPLLALQKAPALVLSPQAGGVDVALLGQGAGLVGEGDLATVRFKVLAAGDPKLRIASVDGRGDKNQKVAVAGAAETQSILPTVTRLTGAQPNPFRQTLTISFSLASRGVADLAVYSVGGRQIRSLARGVRDPGDYSVIWDGRDDGGRAVGAGVYYARLTTSQGRFTRTAIYLK